MGPHRPCFDSLKFSPASWTDSVINNFKKVINDGATLVLHSSDFQLVCKDVTFNKGKWQHQNGKNIIQFLTEQVKRNAGERDVDIKGSKKRHGASHSARSMTPGEQIKKPI